MPKFWRPGRVSILLRFRGSGILSGLLVLSLVLVHEKRARLPHSRALLRLAGIGGLWWPDYCWNNGKHGLHQRSEGLEMGENFSLQHSQSSLMKIPGLHHRRSHHCFHRLFCILHPAKLPTHHLLAH